MTIDLLYKDRIILGVTDDDATWEGADRNSLAMKHKEKIVAAVLKYQKETNWKSLLIKTGIAIAILILLVVLIHFLNKLFHWIRQKIETHGALRLKGLNIKNYALLDTDREIKIFIVLTRIVKWILVLVVVYLTLLLLFGLFPWTKHISEMLLGFFLKPLLAMIRAVIAYFPNLITIVVIVFVFRMAMRGIRFLKMEVENESLGSSGSLSNLIAGLVLTYMRSFKIGDRVRIGRCH